MINEYWLSKKLIIYVQIIELLFILIRNMQNYYSFYYFKEFFYFFSNRYYILDFRLNVYVNIEVLNERNIFIVGNVLLEDCDLFI